MCTCKKSMKYTITKEYQKVIKLWKMLTIKKEVYFVMMNGRVFVCLVIVKANCATKSCC